MGIGQWQFTGISVGMDVAIVLAMVAFVYTVYQNKKEAKEKEKNQNAQAVFGPMQQLWLTTSKHMKVSDQLTPLQQQLAQAQNDSEKQDIQHKIDQVEEVRGSTFHQMSDEMMLLRFNLVALATEELWEEANPYMLSFHGALSGAIGRKAVYSSSDEWRNEGAHHALLSVAGLILVVLKHIRESGSNIPERFIYQLYGLIFQYINGDFKELLTKAKEFHEFDPTKA